MLSIRAILHPTDFSALSEGAFQMAGALARDHGAKLILLHVMTPPISSPELVVAYDEPEDYRAKMWDEFRRLERLDPRIREVDVHAQLVEGEPATEILRAAHEAGCDLIVMGTHGRSGLRRLVMGSVAEQVIRNATCSVLAVKGSLPRAEGDETAQEEPQSAEGETNEPWKASSASAKAISTVRL